MHRGRRPELSRPQQVTEYLRHEIVSGRWPVGEKIPTESELMQELGVGRGAVREGVRSLTALGILEPQVSRGTFVRSLTPVGAAVTGFLGAFGLPELIGFRRALECQAARDAAEVRSEEQLRELTDALESARRRASSAQQEGGPGPVGYRPGRFHAAVFAAAGNRLYDALYGAVMEVLLRAQSEGLLVFGTGPDERGQGHQEVLDAIARQAPDEAEIAMGRHIDVDLVLAPQA